MEAIVHWRIRLNAVYGARLYDFEKLAWLTVSGHYLVFSARTIDKVDGI